MKKIDSITTISVSSFHSIFGQSQSLIIWILIAAGVIFALLGESVDVIAVVLVNAIIVFFQEFNAEKPQPLYRLCSLSTC